MLFLYLLFFSLTKHMKYSYSEIILLSFIFINLLYPIFIHYSYLKLETFKYAIYIFLGITIVKMVKFYYRILPRKVFTNVITVLFQLYFIINAIIALWEIKTGNHLKYGNPSRYTTTWTNIPAALFFNVNDYAIFNSLMIPFFIISIKNHVLSFLLTACSIILIISTGSRTAIITALLLTIISVVTVYKIFPKAQNTIMVVLLIFFAIFVLSYITDNYNDNLLLAKIVNLNLNSRSSVFKEYLEIIIDNPFGYGTAAYGLWASDNLINPHNVFLELILVFGIFFGSLIYFALIYKTSKSFMKSYFNKNDFFISANLSFLMLLIFSNIGISRILYGFPIFWILLSLSLCYLSDNNNNFFTSRY